MSMYPNLFEIGEYVSPVRSVSGKKIKKTNKNNILNLILILIIISIIISISISISSNNKTTTPSTQYIPNIQLPTSTLIDQSINRNSHWILSSTNNHKKWFENASSLVLQYHRHRHRHLRRSPSPSRCPSYPFPYYYFDYHHHSVSHLLHHSHSSWWQEEEREERGGNLKQQLEGGWKNNKKRNKGNPAASLNGGRGQEITGVTVTLPLPGESGGCLHFNSAFFPIPFANPSIIYYSLAHSFNIFNDAHTYTQQQHRHYQRMGIRWGRPYGVHQCRRNLLRHPGIMSPVCLRFVEGRSHQGRPGFRKQAPRRVSHVFYHIFLPKRQIRTTHETDRTAGLRRESSKNGHTRRFLLQTRRYLLLLSMMKMGGCFVWRNQWLNNDSFARL